MPAIERFTSAEAYYATLGHKSCKNSGETAGSGIRGNPHRHAILVSTVQAEEPMTAQGDV
jgi:hypothetical protein